MFLRPTLLAGLLCAVTAGSAQEPAVVLYDFERAPHFSPAGNATATRLETGARVGSGCLQVVFGAKADGPTFALVQAPSEFDLLERLAGQPAINGFRFWFKGDGTAATVLFRVQLRNREQHTDIRGSWTAPVSLQRTDWHLVELPFATLTGPAGRRGMPAETLGEYAIQLQFTASAGLAATCWIDHVEMGVTSGQPKEPEQILDGIDLREQIEAEAAGFAPTPTATLEEPGVAGWRLNGLWYVKDIPIGRPSEGQWQTRRQPDWLGGNRDFRAMWAVRRFDLPADLPAPRLRLRFGSVMAFARVWFNGQLLGEHAGSYTPFTLEVGQAARPGETNTLTVYVFDHSYGVIDQQAFHQKSHTPLFRPGGARTDRMGLTNDIELLAEPAVTIEDVFVRTSTRQQRIEATVEVRNTTGEPVTAALTAAARPVPTPEAVALRLNHPAQTIQPGELARLELSAPWTDPAHWSPANPNLYYLDTELTVGGQPVDLHRVRFGFREFWIEGGEFRLNGLPVRLLGDSQISGHTHLREFSRLDYCRTQLAEWKQHLGINSLRCHAAIGYPAVFQAADEVGLLIIDQSSIWSAGASWYARGGERFLANTRQEFAEWVRRDRNHPSVVIWDVENEMIRGNVDHWSWVERLRPFVLDHDTTRPLEHSGAGWGLGHQDIYHIHHNEHYTGLLEAWTARRDKPMIIGEWWVGGRSGERRLLDGAEFDSREEWLDLQLEDWKYRTHEQRCAGVSGAMPFVFAPWCFQPVAETLPETITWDDPTGPGMQPNRPGRTINPGWWGAEVPASRPIPERARLFRQALGPLFACLEEKTIAVTAGQPFERTVVLANDSEQPHHLAAQVSVVDLASGNVFDSAMVEADLTVGEILRRQVTLTAPPGERLALQVELAGDGRPVSSDRQPLHSYPALPPAPPQAVRIGVYDPPAVSLAWVESLGWPARPVAWPPPLADLDLLVIGEGAFSPPPLGADDLLRGWVNDGGRVLCLRQTAAIDWTPVPFGWYSAQSTIQPAWQGFGLPDPWLGLNFTRHARMLQPDHPVFTDLWGERLAWWPGIDGRVADAVLIKPNLKPTATAANLVPLAGGTRREHLSLAEVQLGAGKYLLCQLHLLANRETPVVQRLGRNLVTVATAQPARGRVLVLGESLGQALRQELRAAVDVAAPGSHDGAGYDTVICAREVTDAQIAALRAPTILMMPRTSPPPGLAGEISIAAQPQDASFVTVRPSHRIFAGLNCWDFQRWPEPLITGQTQLTGNTARPLLNAHRLPESFTGGGVGLMTNQMQPRGLAAVATTVDGRELVLCQINLDDPTVPRASYVWSVMLTNLGVAIEPPLSPTGGAAAAVRRVGDVTLDGKLDEWLCEIEDRNVTNWTRAVPIVLREANAVVYLTWEPGWLYLAGWQPAASEPLSLTLESGEGRWQVTVTPEGAVTAPAGLRAAAASGPAVATNLDAGLLRTEVTSPLAIEVAVPAARLGLAAWELGATWPLWLTVNGVTWPAAGAGETPSAATATLAP